ncbi:MAG: hypothetical protein MJ091_00990 [Clostridia bacterium]|nr:hypothetical protein [Clostridia bacterium]
MGIFGNLFDLNGNGKSDPIEQAIELTFIADIIEKEKDLESEENEDSLFGDEEE